MPLSPLLASYEHVLLDLDGCVWVGDVPTRQAPAALERLRSAGKTVSFLTNDARSTPEEYVRKLWALGLRASLEEMVTVGSALQHVLAERRPRIPTYVIGAPAIFRHVSDAGARIVNGTEQAAEAEIVVIAGHDDFSFQELRIATRAVLGDRLDSDLAGAAAAGIDGAIVLTGAATRPQAEAATDPAPVAIAEDLYALVTA